MLEYLKKETEKTFTENGAVTYTTSGSYCLDLFATIGALRHASKNEIETRFCRAFAEDRDAAMKLLFFARDVRGGLGERRCFRILLRWLANEEPECLRKNLAHVAEYGRFDDLLCLLDTPCEKDVLSLLHKQFEADREALDGDGEVSLLGKWLPSANASAKKTVRQARTVARSFGLREAEYRRILTALRARIRILENNLRERDYSFSYEKQPSRALYKYRAAFLRNDCARYTEYLDRVTAGEATLHADNLAPYELVEPYLEQLKNRRRPLTRGERNALNATWSSLPDYGGEADILTVIDTSASMYYQSHPTPASVALSLALYFAERNRGRFANSFIEFSDKPQLIEIKGETFADRLRYVSSFCRVANTNLESVFSLILRTAVKYHLPESEMPAKLVIISDMEFDACVQSATSTVFESAKTRFLQHGYRLPEIVFWNVASRNRQQPVTQNERGVALVSGCTPRLFGMVAGGIADPYTFMQEVLTSERYARIAA